MHNRQFLGLPGDVATFAELREQTAEAFVEIGSVGYAFIFPGDDDEPVGRDIGKGGDLRDQVHDVGSGEALE